MNKLYIKKTTFQNRTYFVGKFRIDGPYLITFNNKRQVQSYAKKNGYIIEEILK